MKLRSILIAACILSASAAFAQQIDPITQATLKGNTEWLQEHPGDYEALFERAAIYLQLHRFDEAYIDIVKAIDNTPAKERDANVRNFSLLSDILIAQDNLPKALEAINKALEIDPTAYANIYKKGNILLELKRPDEAYATFASLQRLKSRSQEAFFGMAKAKAMSGNMDDARDLIKEVEQAAPTAYQTYLRIGDFYKSIGLNEDAASNYLLAFTLTDTSSAPMNALINLGRTDYPAVAGALKGASAKTQNNVPLDFLLANIALRAGAYNDAYQSYSSLLQSPDGNDPDILAGMANAALALNKITEAQTASASALTLEQSPELYILRSKVQRAAGLNTDALAAAEKALQLAPNSVNAMNEVALNHIALKNFDQAYTILSEAIMINADNPLPLMLRAYVAREGLKDDKKATADWNRVAIMQAETFPEIAYTALAKTLSGKKIDGDAIIESGLTRQTGKDAAYWAAIYYAQTGNLDKARQWRDRAVALGYSNAFNLNANTDANLNLSPIR